MLTNTGIEHTNSHSETLEVASNQTIFPMDTQSFDLGWEPDWAAANWPFLLDAAPDEMIGQTELGHSIQQFPVGFCDFKYI